MKVTKLRPFTDYARERIVQLRLELRELEGERAALDLDILNWGRLRRYLARRHELQRELDRLERAVRP